MKNKLMRTMVLLTLITGSICSGAFAQNNDAPRDKSDPNKWHDEGLYYYNKNEPGNLFVLIDPSMPSGTKSGGYGQSVAQAYSGGFARQKNEAILAGASSKTVIHETKPTFYFYFKADNITPKSFALVSFIKKRHDRILVTGSSNAYGSTTGIDEKQLVDFTYQKLSDGIFKVYPKEALPEGEYCFYYTGKAESSFAEGFYDFGISKE